MKLHSVTFICPFDLGGKFTQRHVAGAGGVEALDYEPTTGLLTVFGPGLHALVPREQIRLMVEREPEVVSRDAEHAALMQRLGIENDKAEETPDEETPDESTEQMIERLGVPPGWHVASALMNANDRAHAATQGDSPKEPDAEPRAGRSSRRTRSSK